ncbi:MAG: ankyrin repeat domain-containing protein [Candidatus Endonucleobacter sp. (ex Gigantidas childressi)]|nr:ankyrin repeat domain-containing protein [Candidatus Endonucleobacter sp. (ex Gigantidas childressi)]
MKHVLSVMMLLVFFPIQRGMAALDAADQVMPVDWILANNDMVKIIVPITLYNEDSVGAMVDINGVEVPTGMLTEVFSFVYGSNENRDEIQNAGLNNKIDTVNACDTCPVTVNKLQKDGFDFVVIKQSNTECLKIHSVKVKPVEGFVSVQKTLSLKEMFSFTPIKESKVDEQAQDGLFDINNLSIDLLEKDRLPLAENSSYSFVLYIPCRVKDATDDDSHPSYSAFFFRNNGIELQKAFCKLKELDECYVMCAICRDSLIDQREVVVTTCNHRYHKSCIATWFELKETTKGVKEKTCPYCRDNKLLPLRYASNNDSDQIYFKDDPAQACIDGNLGVLENLYAQDHTICNQRFFSFTDGEQCPLLYFAISHGHINIAKFLIKHGSDATIDYLTESLEKACGTEHKHIIEFLLSKGARVDGVIQSGSSSDYGARPIPLHTAIMSNQVGVVKYLLEQGAKVNIENKAGKCPLFVAAENGHKDIIKLLLGYNAYVDANDEELVKSIMVMGDLDLFKFVFGNIDWKDILFANGRDCFELAVEGGDSQFIKYLGLKKNMDISYKHDLVRMAVLTDNFEKVKYLVDDLGADLNYTSGSEKSPLDLAIDKGSAMMVDHLIKHGAKIDRTSASWPLLEAVSKKNCSVIQCLIDHKALINEVVRGISPLYVAVRMGDLNVIECLCKNGADTHNPDAVNRSF